MGIDSDLRGTNTLYGKTTLAKLFLHPSEKESTSERKEFSPKGIFLRGGNSFLLE